MKFAIIIAYLLGATALAAGPETYIVRGTSSKVRTSSVLNQFTVEKRLQGFDGFTARMTEAQAKELTRQGYLVERDGVMRVMGERRTKVKTTDPIPWGIQAVKAIDAHQLVKGTGAGVTICVVDTGIDDQHEALKGRVVGGKAFAKAHVAGREEWFDDMGHGTHVSGTAAGSGPLMGVAPEAKLYAVKVLDASGSGSFSDVADGIKACIGNAQVMNLSIGASVPSQIVEDALKAAVKGGMQIACAAGNDSGPVNYPAKYSECQAVSAINSKLALADFSSKGAEVDFAAPGVDVKSSTPNNSYETWDGTSMATPHVAGVMAIKESRGKRTVKANRLVGLKDTEQGKGLVDALQTAK